MLSFHSDLNVFTTCPQSRNVSSADYLHSVKDVATWSEGAGCTGILIYSDNAIVDAWLVAQVVLQSTHHLCPLIAVQPIYMHPFVAAKFVASLGFMHRRRVWLNMLAGGFKNDLSALGDEMPHDERYVRTAEYAHIIRQLLEATEPATFEGRYYQLHGLRMTPALPRELLPGFLISGSSEAGRIAAMAIGATAVEYPRPAAQLEAEERPSLAGLRRGLRIGIIARSHAEEAWQIAQAKFPEDRRGQLAHSLAIRTSDSIWHKQLSELAGNASGKAANMRNPYWLSPFENYGSFCPYLVGDYDTVGAEIARYLRLGYLTYILDIPSEANDLEAAQIAFARAFENVGPLDKPLPGDSGDVQCRNL